MSKGIPEELKDTAETFLRLCTKHKFSFMGMLLSNTDNSVNMVVRNVNDPPENLGEVFRAFGELMDGAVKSGNVKISKPTPVI